MMRKVPFDKRGTLAMRADLWGSPFFVSEKKSQPFETVGNAAIVCIEGPLTHHSDWFWDSYDAIAERVTAAIESSAKVVVLKIDSPGGDVSGCFETARAIRAAAQAAGKRIVAYADGAASAGYALACMADEIALPSTGYVGSIGCISTLVDYVAANERYGVNFALVASGARKTYGNPNVPISDAAIANTKKDVDTLARLFFDLVAESRGMSVDAIAALDAGLILGAEAIAAGLADRVCTFNEFLEAIASEQTTTAPRAGAQQQEKAMAGWKDEMKKAAAEGDEDAKKALDAMGEDEKPAAEDDKDKPAAEDDKEKPAAEDDAPPKKDDDEEKDKAAARATRSASAKSPEDRIRAIEEKEERRELLAKRPDFGHDPALAKRMASAPLAAVRWNVENLPRIAAPKSATTGTAPKSATNPLAHAGAITPGVTRSEGEGDGYRGVTRKSDQAEALDRALGFTQQTEFVTDVKNKRVIRLMTPAQARDHQKKIQARNEAALNGGK